MQNQRYVRQPSGSKAIAIDNRQLLLKIRLQLLLAMILSAASAVGLRLLFAH